MHCILNYPTEDSDANLRMISSLQKEFPNCISGYSDHTLPKKYAKSYYSLYFRRKSN